MARELLVTKNSDRVGQGAKSAQSEIWLRISAFLNTKAPNSQRTYLAVIREWSEFLGEEPGSEKSAAKISRARDIHAAAYLDWLKKQPGMRPRAVKSVVHERRLSNERRTKSNDGTMSTLSNTTIAKKITVLHKIYSVLVRARLVETNPFAGDLIVKPSVHSGQKRPTEMLDYSKVKQLLTLPDLKTNSGVQDSAILSLLFGGGLRRSELLKLTLDDVRATRRGTTYLRLRATKAKRDADQALPQWAAQALARQLSARIKQGALPGDNLFVTYTTKHKTKNRSLSETSLYRIFRRYCMLSGVTPFASPHSARATAITKLLDDGLSHREVKEFSRHASVEMVELYDKRRYSVDESPGKGLDFSGQK